MRMIMMLLAVAAATFAAGATPARAEITYPWCAQYSGTEGGGGNCGFVTMDQCRATVSGVGGFCYANPMYAPAGAAGPRRVRR
jgi:hypothetical protein